MHWSSNFDSSHLQTISHFLPLTCVDKFATIIIILSAGHSWILFYDMSHQAVQLLLLLDFFLVLESCAFIIILS